MKPVFDFGDTLVPSRKLIQGFVRDWLRERGVEDPPEFDIYRYRIYTTEEVSEFLRENGIQADAAELRQEYLEREERYMEENGVIELLKRCNEEFGPVGMIVDNSTEGGEFYRRVFRERNVEFDCITVSEDVGVEKPAREIFEAFLDCRDADGEEFVYLGNHAERDSACEQVGMEFVWVTQHDTFGTSWSGKKIEELTFESVKEVCS